MTSAVYTVASIHESRAGQVHTFSLSQAPRLERVAPRFSRVPQKAVQVCMHHNGISKNIFHNMKVLTSRTINMSTKLRLLKCYVWSTLLYGCDSWTVSQRMKSQLEATEMWFYGVCCVLRGPTKCQMQKYFKERMHQKIS